MARRSRRTRPASRGHAQTVSRLRPLSRRRLSVSRPARVLHALPEPVGAGALALLGLVGALHGWRTEVVGWTAGPECSASVRSDTASRDPLHRVVHRRRTETSAICGVARHAPDRAPSVARPEVLCSPPSGPLAGACIAAPARRPPRRATTACRDPGPRHSLALASRTSSAARCRPRPMRSGSRRCALRPRRRRRRAPRPTRPARLGRRALRPRAADLRRAVLGPSAGVRLEPGDDDRSPGRPASRAARRAPLADTGPGSPTAPATHPRRAPTPTGSTRSTPSTSS